MRNNYLKKYVSVVVFVLFTMVGLCSCGSHEQGKINVAASGAPNQDGDVTKESSADIQPKQALGKEPQQDQKQEQKAKTFASPGDMFVTNMSGDVVLLNGDGYLKNIIVDANKVLVEGLSWNPKSQKVLLPSIGSGLLFSVSVVSGFSEIEFSYSQKLIPFDISVFNNEENFLLAHESGVDLLSLNGDFIKTIVPNQAFVSEVFTTKDGGFVLCSNDVSNSLGRVQRYSAKGQMVGKPAIGKKLLLGNQPHAKGCAPLKSGNIAVSWSGQTGGRVDLFSKYLKTHIGYFENDKLLKQPAGIAQLPNGNVLVVDSFYNHIIELELTKEKGEKAFSYVKTIESKVLAEPKQILVVPKLK